jgi:hypothetical protein
MAFNAGCSGEDRGALGGWMPSPAIASPNLLVDRDAALAKCLWVLRSGGRLVVTEPNDQPMAVAGSV